MSSPTARVDPASVRPTPVTALSATCRVLSHLAAPCCPRREPARGMLSSEMSRDAALETTASSSVPLE